MKNKDMKKEELEEMLYNAFIDAQAEVGGTAYGEILDTLHSNLNKKYKIEKIK